jgi:dynein heavy chain
LLGLHLNASITQAINDTQAILSDILQISRLTPSSSSNVGSGNASGAGQALRLINEIVPQIRDTFKIKEVEKKFPFKYEESMNSVLLQELARYNTLIEVI